MDDVERRIGMLKKGGEPGARGIVALALGYSGDVRAIPALIDALRDEEWLVREAAAGALEEIGFENIGSDDKILCLLLLERYDKITEIGDPAVSGLIDALGDADKAVHMSAFEALVKIAPIADMDLGKIRAFLKGFVSRRELTKRRAISLYAKIANAVSERKRKEMPGVLSSGKIKPPKKEMYRMRRVSNG